MVPVDIHDYPKEFKFTELLTHFVMTRVPAGCNFRCGDWLRFLHDDYLDMLGAALQAYESVNEDIRQDLTLLCQLLITHETENAAQTQSARLISAVLQQMCAIVPLEQNRRAGVLFVEQRVSAIPNKPLDIHPTIRGRSPAGTPSPDAQDTGTS